MAEALNGHYTTTKPVTLAHPHLIEPQTFKDPKTQKPKGDPKFSVTFVLDPASPDVPAIKSLALKLAEQKWPGRNVKADVAAGHFHVPWSSGDKAADKYTAKRKAGGKDDDGKGEFQRGKVLIKSSSKFPVNLAVLENGKISPNLEGPAIAANGRKFYFGVEAMAIFNLVPYDKVGDSGVDGITIYPELVMSLNRGERLTGGAAAAEVFKDYVGHETAEDPTGQPVDDNEAF